MKNKYHFNISIGTVKHNAGTKAVNDCKTILINRGFKNMELQFVKKPHLMVFNFFKLTFLLIKAILVIKANSFVVVQYPLLGVNNFFDKFIRILHWKKCAVACIIHDLESLRIYRNKKSVQKEISNLNAYDAIISHNLSMTNWLKVNGVKVPTVDLEIFDYLDWTRHTGQPSIEPQFAKSIVFAGSLERGKFLHKLKMLPGNIKFKLYGTLKDKDISDGLKVKAMGSFPPDDIVANLTGSFGLIWDGDEIWDCTGQFGDYLQYNNPHKFSLYIAASLPIILPAKAALARFVLDNKIGFTIQGIQEIDTKISFLSENEYDEMKLNLLKMSEKVKSGYFFNKALDQVETLLYLK